MKKLYTILILTIALAVNTYGQTLPYLSNPTFKEGEKLTYKLKYGIISASLTPAKSNIKYLKLASLLR